MGFRGRIAAVASRRYRSLAAWLTRYRIVRRLTTRLKRGMRAPDVLELLDALDKAGVRASVAGGWGVDALVGSPTRKHLDLDLVVDHEQLAPTQEALTRLGFTVRFEQVVAHAGLPDSLTMGDGDGRKVDIHPVDLTAEPFASHPFVVGTVAGRPVSCLSPHLQLAFRRVYEAREADAHDIALLSDHLRRGPPT